jgi:hypothetical protein
MACLSPGGLCLPGVSQLTTGPIEVDEKIFGSMKFVNCYFVRPTSRLQSCFVTGHVVINERKTK